MHIRVCSDLHLEGFLGRNFETLAIDFIPKDERDQEAVLVLAGDISSNPDQLIGFIHTVEERFKKVIFVPGNHELYKNNLPAWNAQVSHRMGMYLVNTLFTDASTVKTAEVDGVRFIFGTLWADGGPTLQDRAITGHYLNDFRLIRNGPDYQRFTVQDMMEIHTTQKRQIREALEVPFDGKTVVVTHHLPSRRLVSDRFWPRDGSDGANGGFASDCDNMICTLEPNIWIHGHTHDTIDTKLWETRVVCNPAGYRGEYATQFNTYMTSELREDGTRRAIVQPKFVEV